MFSSKFQLKLKEENVHYLHRLQIQLRNVLTELFTLSQLTTHFLFSPNLTSLIHASWPCMYNCVCARYIYNAPTLITYITTFSYALYMYIYIEHYKNTMMCWVCDWQKVTVNAVLHVPYFLDQTPRLLIFFHLAGTSGNYSRTTFT